MRTQLVASSRAPPSLTRPCKSIRRKRFPSKLWRSPHKRVTWPSLMSEECLSSNMGYLVNPTATPIHFLKSSSARVAKSNERRPKGSNKYNKVPRPPYPYSPSLRPLGRALASAAHHPAWRSFHHYAPPCRQKSCSGGHAAATATRLCRPWCGEGRRLGLLQSAYTLIFQVKKRSKKSTRGNIPFGEERGPISPLPPPMPACTAPCGDPSSAGQNLS